MQQHAVLVTGGSGFLGQHVVKHIDMYMKDVTEIRVLDVKPYQKHLDFKETAPVKSFTGSITDVQLVRKACCGVRCVFHIASIIDLRMFPDTKVMNEINILGTQTVIDACRDENVEYLIYCSSLSSVYNDNGVLNGTETSVPIPTKCNYCDYGESKRKAQNLVMKSNGILLKNGKALKTIALLPPGMYGEQNKLYLDQILQFKQGTQYRFFGRATAPQQHLYVGNAAILFIQAYKSLRENVELGGQHFFALDDTPNHTAIEMRGVFIPVENPVLTPSACYIPARVTSCLFLIVYCILYLLRFFCTLNFPISRNVLLYSSNTSFIVSSDKARTLLNYKPLYDYETSMRNTKAYYRSLIERKENNKKSD